MRVVGVGDRARPYEPDAWVRDLTELRVEAADGGVRLRVG
ncbi:hypothetical protein GCM10020256_54350 [Streptomyces thermocoprophilus]